MGTTYRLLLAGTLLFVSLGASAQENFGRDGKPMGVVDSIDVSNYSAIEFTIVGSDQRYALDGGGRELKGYLFQQLIISKTTNSPISFVPKDGSNVVDAILVGCGPVAATAKPAPAVVSPTPALSRAERTGIPDEERGSSGKRDH